MMKQMLTTFGEHSQGLRELATSLAGDVESVSNTVSECSDGVTDASGNINELVSEVGEIVKDVATNQDVVSDLGDEVGRFKNLEGKEDIDNAHD